MNRVVFNDRPAQSFSSDGALACISHAIVHGAYKDALASELFRPEYNQLTGLSGFSGLAGILPELNRSDNAGLVLVGTFRPESLIIADLAERKNIPHHRGEWVFARAGGIFHQPGKPCLRGGGLLLARGGTAKLCSEIYVHHELAANPSGGWACFSRDPEIERGGDPMKDRQGGSSLLLFRAWSFCWRSFPTQDVRSSQCDH